MNHYTYLVDVLVAALDRMGVRALGARPLLLTTQASAEDAALSFHLLQAFPMASVIEKGNELYSKLSDATGEAWKSVDGLVALPGAAPTPQQLVAATRFATSFIGLLVKDDAVSSLFPLFNQTPMRRVCVGTGTGFSLLIASKRIVYAMDSTAFVQLTPMDAQLWALSPEEWRASFVMRMQHALLPAYAAFAAAAATPNVNVNVPFLTHPSSQFMQGPVSSPPMFFPGPAPLNPIFGTMNAAANVASSAVPGASGPSASSASMPSFPSNSQFSLPPMPPGMGGDRMQMNAAMMAPQFQQRGSISMPNPPRRVSVVPSMLPMPDLSDARSSVASDEPYGLDGLAAGALASIVKRGSQEESDSDNGGSGGDSGSEQDNHNSLLFLKGSLAANQGRHLEGAIRKFKNQFSKKDVITRVCKMKYRSAQRKLRIAKYIEIWPEIATMSQRAAERYISQNLKKRVDVPATVGSD